MTNKEIINKLKEFELIINEMKETNIKLKEENKQFKQLLDISYAEAKQLKSKISYLEEENKKLEKEKNVEKQQPLQKKEKIKINVQCQPNNEIHDDTKPEVVENTIDNKSRQANTQISLNTISDEWLEKSIILDNESGLLKVVYPPGFDKEYSKKIVNLLLNSYLAKKDSNESKKIFYVLNGKIISNFSVNELKELKNCS